MVAFLNGGGGDFRTRFNWANRPFGKNVFLKNSIILKDVNNSFHFSYISFGHFIVFLTFLSAFFISVNHINFVVF